MGAVYVRNNTETITDTAVDAVETEVAVLRQVVTDIYASIVTMRFNITATIGTDGTGFDVKVYDGNLAGGNDIFSTSVAATAGDTVTASFETQVQLAPGSRDLTITVQVADATADTTDIAVQFTTEVGN